MKTKIFLVIAIFTTAVFAQAKVKPNAKAPQGGTLYYNLGAEPESIHPIMSSDLYEQYISSFGHDTLCDKDIETYETIPRLAEKWEISKDGLTFTFHLRKNMFFHNGDPITADEVKFSIDTIKEPKHQALNVIPYIEGFTKVEVVDPLTIRFTAKEKYFKNLDSICGIIKVIPKSAYGDIEKSIKMQKEFVGAGPYKMEKYDKGQSITLKKFDKWYGKDVPELKGFYNFDQIVFRITKDDNVIIERFRKGDLDFYPANMDAYLKAEKGMGDKAKAVKVVNDQPKGYGYIAFNFRNPILAELSTRQAIAHLTNRAEMNKKFRNGMSDLATGPVSIRSHQAADVKTIEFSPKKAQEILKTAGWSDSDKDGVLDRMKDGKKEEMRFTMIYANKDSEKYWTMFKEDTKKAGVDITLKFLEWNSFIKTIEDNNMELYTMAWGGGSVEMDPKQIWHSTSSAKGGSNRGAYANAEVDKLIDEGRAELDEKKRSAMFKKAYTLIAKDVPYVFLWNNKYEFYLSSTRIKKPADTFRYDFGVSSWWAP